MLTRIYGTAFFDQADLDAHLERIEEARRRDHRRLGRELDLFHLSETSPGSPFWHPRGMVLFNELGRFWRELNAARGYEEVKTPILFGTDLWKRSGHWDNYRDKMFLTEQVEGRQFGLKPMNCPGHVEIYNNKRHSYRDLPLRLAEQGLVHRNEDSGSMHGLLRVRHITQDDAHIFCRWDQVEDEVVGCLDLASVIYATFGLDVRAELSTRPEKRLGSEEEWDRMEAALASALATAGWDYAVNPGDGAFYAPKIDLHMNDSIGRSWQMGTIQLDGWMPQRLDATYTTSEDQLERPFMIHRALFGAFERFIGILIEHFAGAFPLWLAPRAGRRAARSAASCASTATRSSPPCAPPACAPSWTRARRRSGARSATPRRRRCPSCSCSAAARPRRAASRCAAAAASTRRQAARRRGRRARRRGARATARSASPLARTGGRRLRRRRPHGDRRRLRGAEVGQRVLDERGRVSAPVTPSRPKPQ